MVHRERDLLATLAEALAETWLGLENLPVPILLTSPAVVLMVAPVKPLLTA